MEEKETQEIWGDHRTKTGTIVIIIVVVALALRIWGYDFGLPNIVHPDESKLVQPTLEILNFNRLNVHPGHFIYPAGYIYVLTFVYGLYALILLLSGNVAGLESLATFLYSQTSYLHIVGRLTTAVTGALTVFLVYLAVKELFDKRAGVVSAAFLSVAYVHTMHSHYVTTDVPTGLMTVICLYFSVRLYKTGKLKHLLLAGVFAGISGGFKYPAVVVGFVPVAAYTLCIIEDGRPLWEIFNRRLWAIIALIAAGFILLNPYALADWPLFAWDLLKLKFDVADLPFQPHQGATGPFDYFIRLRPSLGLGWPMVSCLMISLIAVPARWKQKAVILFTFPTAYYSVAVYPDLHIMRYLVLAAPVFCCMAGSGLVALTDLTLSSSCRTGIIIVISGAIVIHSLVGVVRWDLAAADPQPPREQASRWIRQNVEARAVFLILSSAEELRYYPVALIDDAYCIRQLEFSTGSYADKRVRFLLNMANHPLWREVAERVLARGTAVEASRKQDGFAGVLSAETIAASQRDIQIETFKKQLSSVEHLQAGHDLPSLDSYLQEGVPTYAIISKPERTFFKQPIASDWQEAIEQIRAYYTRIRTEWELVAEFHSPVYRRVPYETGQDYVGHYDIEIYMRK